MSDAEFMESMVESSGAANESEQELNVSRKYWCLFVRHFDLRWQITITSITVSGTGERSKSNIAVPANCNVSMAVVSLIDDLPNDEGLFQYYPTCTRVERCSGCCSTPLFECQPTSVEDVLVNVRRLSYNRDTEKFGQNGVVPVIVKVHRSCKCGCRVRAEHCNHLQEYDKAECKCNCTNVSELNRCSDVSNMTNIHKFKSYFYAY